MNLNDTDMMPAAPIIERSFHTHAVNDVTGTWVDVIDRIKVSNFAMLGCETKELYGPLSHTAQLFVDLLGMSARTIRNDDVKDGTKVNEFFIRMHVYNTQEMEYPQDDSWDSYDGIIIPGSFSAAYDTDPWIERLKHVIQTKIVPYHRKTLGICFGHQVFAHSFTHPSNQNNRESGSSRAVPTPSGPRAGQFTMPLTPAGGDFCPRHPNKMRLMETIIAMV
jgi:hypothetical protein